MNEQIDQAMKNVDDLERRYLGVTCDADAELNRGAEKLSPEKRKQFLGEWKAAMEEVERLNSEAKAVHADFVKRIEEAKKKS